MAKFPSFTLWFEEQRERQDDLGKLVRDLSHPRRRVEMFVHSMLFRYKKDAWKLTLINAFREYKTAKLVAKQAK